MSIIKGIINLLRGKDHADSSLIKTCDEHGNNISIEDRRARQRESFTGRPIMKSHTFTLLCGFIHSAIGLSLEADDKLMLESRLMGRIRALDMATFEEYLGYLCSRRGIDAELDQLIDCVSTSKTYFYRQPDHFEFIVDNALPKLLQNKKTIRTWSVGCASGEEAYTLAMVLAQGMAKHEQFNYSILATDISPLALKRAVQAEYDNSKLTNLPDKLKTEYMRPEGDNFTVSYDIRQRVTFKRLNLLDDSYCINEQMDIALYRNVGIYFDEEQQHSVVKRICDNLSDGGYLLLGHTEFIDGLDSLPLERVRNSVYIKRQESSKD